MEESGNAEERVTESDSAREGRIDLTQFEARTRGPWAVLRHEDYPEEEAPANKHLVCISSQSGIDEKDQPHWDSLSVAFIDNRWAEDMAEWNTRLEYSATRGTSREMLDANAKAIAAVPELIAELKRCYDLIDAQKENIEFFNGVVGEIHEETWAEKVEAFTEKNHPSKWCDFTGCSMCDEERGYYDNPLELSPELQAFYERGPSPRRTTEKQMEEAQRKREYGYSRPSVDDYDPMYDDPNYEGPME